CAPAGGGNTVIQASCPAGDNTVGYLAADRNTFVNQGTIADTTARYVVAGKGVRTNVARNSFYSPGFSVLNLSLGKEFHFTEGKYLRAKVDVFNVLNHPNFAISNGNVFSTAGITTATTTPGYVRPADR